MSEKLEKPGNPYDMDSSSFDADKYLQKLLQTCSLKQIMDIEDNIVKDTQTLHSEMQTLVYENYNKFISATDTIRKMKTDFKQMETEMSLLDDKMNSVTSFSDQINGTLQETRTQLTRLSGKHSLLKRLQFLSSLPAKLSSQINEKNYVQAVQDYNHAQKVLQQYGDQPSFQGIQKDCAVIITDLKKHLKEEFQKAGKTAQSLTETGELLLELDEKPSELCKEMLHFATQRLHEQLVMLQDQTDRDMIEFIDMGIEGFLNDLTLVTSSYFDMFLTKHFENEDDNFETAARNDLNLFVIKNMNEYLSLVQDRTESESHGDSHILLRALDRLHRRLNAMRNMGRGIEFRKNGMELIISSAQQLCNSHFKNLKDSFSDSLSSIRLTLVTSKNDNSSVNLNELINTLYVSTIEKVKGVLQDLMVFLNPEWSFNIRSDYKGTLCIEGIRENLLVAFLRHTAAVMTSFSDVNSSCPPNLLLVLSKTCLTMDKSGVRSLINLVDELYEIESENSATLTHESELSSEMRDAAQTLLDAYVRAQGLNISQMLRKSVESRDWLNCLEPRSVRAVMKRVVEEFGIIETILEGLYDSGVRTSASSDSSRKTHYSINNIQNAKQYRSNWSNYASSSQLDNSFVSNIHRLFSERVDVFSAIVEFSKTSIMSGIIRISLKTLLECVRLRTFSKFGLQQIQVDVHYLQMNLWRFVSDENVIHYLLDEVLGSAVLRCLEPILMEPNAVEIICERC